MVNESVARTLINRYINGWKHNSPCEVCDTLAANCTIIESHGPTYHGIEQVQRWLQLWLEANGEISKWELLSFCYCSEHCMAFVEWDFSCKVGDSTYAFLGASSVNFANDKILHIKEYCITNTPFNWKGDRLILE